MLVDTVALLFVLLFNIYVKADSTLTLTVLDYLLKAVKAPPQIKRMFSVLIWMKS